MYKIHHRASCGSYVLSYVVGVCCKVRPYDRTMRHETLRGGQTLERPGLKLSADIAMQFWQISRGYPIMQQTSHQRGQGKRTKAALSKQLSSLYTHTNPSKTAYALWVASQPTATTSINRYPSHNLSPAAYKYHPPLRKHKYYRSRQRPALPCSYLFICKIHSSPHQWINPLLSQIYPSRCSRE